jgi:hypothetical protein
MQFAYCTCVLQEPNYVYDGDYEYDEYVPNGGAIASGGPPKVSCWTRIAKQKSSKAKEGRC